MCLNELTTTRRTIMEDEEDETTGSKRAVKVDMRDPITTW
jgi:hypothetical protein